jgi:hypothetical protein
MDLDELLRARANMSFRVGIIFVAVVIFMTLILIALYAL